MDALDQVQSQEDALLERRIAAIPRSGSAAEAPAARDCSGCGAPIAPVRLRALPAARLCIECQREAEGRA